MKQFVLFVCSQAMIRSRTAEVLTLLGGMPARCCGTDSDAFVPLSNALLLGASEVVCMERHHAKAVNEMMGAEDKAVCSLGVPDEFEPFEARLVDVLVAALRDRSPEVAKAIERGNALMVERGMDFND